MIYCGSRALQVNSEGFKFDSRVPYDIIPWGLEIYHCQVRLRVGKVTKCDILGIYVYIFDNSATLQNTTYIIKHPEYILHRTWKQIRNSITP